MQQNALVAGGRWRNERTVGDDHGWSKPLEYTDTNDPLGTRKTPSFLAKKHAGLFTGRVLGASLYV